MRKTKEMRNFGGGFSNITELLKRTRRRKVDREGVEGMMAERGCTRER